MNAIEIKIADIKIVSDREVLHQVTFDNGPRITRVQLVDVGGTMMQNDFWTQNGRVVTIKSGPATAVELARLKQSGKTCPHCGCSGQVPDSLKCDDCGADFTEPLTECCGIPFDADHRICPRCKEHV